jgi:ABC-type nitrate/sulfonate/bicarbonate transport system permease component
VTARAGRVGRGSASRWGPRIAGAGFLAAVIALLQLAVASGLISSFLVPTPIDVLASFGMLVTEEHLLRRFAMTAAETVSAACVAMLIGGLAGWALYRWEQARLAYTSWIVGLNAAPSLLLYPLFLVVVGRSAATIVALGAISALPPIVLNTCEGLRASRRILLDVGRSFDLTTWQQFRLIQCPAALPTFFSGVRISLINALITVVGVEFLIGYGGLGALIPDLADRFEVPAMCGAIVFVILMSASVQLVVRRLERWLRPV